jgi:hypothetical protein
MVFNATFNNISVISWWSVLLVGEIRIPGENHRPVQKNYCEVISKRILIIFAPEEAEIFKDYLFIFR